MNADLLMPMGRVAAPSMDLDQFKAHIRTLITLEESEAPVLSCYINLDAHWNGGPLFDRNLRLTLNLLDREERRPFDEAFHSIEEFLAREVCAGARGVAAFSRGGLRPFFLGLQFQVPLPNHLGIDQVPNIYHLVELKDSYHRYVVLITTEKWARILEVNLGAITKDLWVERPELRERVGREWTQEHYRNHRHDRGERFLGEKIAILDKLMSAGGYTHLILAGSPPLTTQVRARLPKHLAAKLIDIVAVSADTRTLDVVAATLASFVEREQQESLDSVSQLVAGIRRGGLAVAGTDATLDALQSGQADVLVMAKGFQARQGWCCQGCGWVFEIGDKTSRCNLCDSGRMKPVNLKEAMLKLAERYSALTDLVSHSVPLMKLGGVGCLLRYAKPQQGC